MKSKILIYTIFFSVFVFSQDRSGIISTILPQGYEVNSLSGYGFENVNLVTASNISNSNPALITELKRTCFGITKKFNSAIDDAYAGFRYKQLGNWYPQSAGFVTSFDDLFIGAGFTQTYNAELSVEPVPVTTAEYPDGTGEFLTYSTGTVIYTSSLIAAVPVYNLFSENDQLSLGAQFNYHLINNKETLFSYNHNKTFDDVNFSAGLFYKSPSSFRAGLFFEKGVIMSTVVEPETLPVQNDTNRDDQFYGIIVNSTYLYGFIPDRLSLGVSADASEMLKISGNVAGVFWSGYQEALTDQVEFSGNGHLKFTEDLTVSFGFYLTNREHKMDSDIYEFNAVFLSAGALLKISSFDLELAVADSHLFSDEPRKQTMGKIGVNIGL